ncbi:hypothetical protein, partial [Streptomyces sp. NPDC097610]|uniref:hypothetical protein n=1 Tax=Streptomyces sp. NPDC097610 TaxID=3157227 RepID=UPI00332CA39D
TFPAPPLDPVGPDDASLADVVPIRRRAEGTASCRRIQPWRTQGRLACASDLDCDPDKLCVDGACI